MKPDFSAQFRNTEAALPRAYMGGVSASCGEHPSLPKRHRWGAWKRIEIKRGRPFWERTCRTCALVSDARYTPPSGDSHHD